jgi:hypothetical protein
MLANAPDINATVSTIESATIEADPGVEDSWSVVEYLGREMRGAAAASDWQHVLNLAGDRHRHLLHHFDKYPVGPENAIFYRTRLHDMLLGEQDMQRLATDARREVLREGLMNNKNYRAAQAYLA